MRADSIANENWQVLVSAFPSGWRELGRSTNAIKHDLKDFNSEDDLLRVLLLHVGCGYSLRETAVLAKLGNLAEVSDVAILKRLRKSEFWLLELCRSLLKETGIRMPAIQLGTSVRLVDSSVIKEPGKTGSQWRLHFSLRLPDLVCDSFEITSVEGSGTGETLARYPVEKGDYIIGDRGYSRSQGIDYVHEKKGYVLVRFHSSCLPLFEEKDVRFDTLKAISSIQNPLAVMSWPVYVKGEGDRLIAGRLCGLRKSEEKIAQAHKRLREKESKSGKKTRPATFEFAKYVLIFSTFPENEFTSQSLLEYYRLRWQIELLFKRLKTLLEFGHLPKFDPSSARAWLYGKLFLALLTEKLARISRAFSPWGYFMPEQMEGI